MTRRWPWAKHIAHGLTKILPCFCIENQVIVLAYRICLSCPGRRGSNAPAGNGPGPLFTDRSRALLGTVRTLRGFVQVRPTISPHSARSNCGALEKYMWRRVPRAPGFEIVRHRRCVIQRLRDGLGVNLVSTWCQLGVNLESTWTV